MNKRLKELDKAAQEYAGTMAGNDEDSNYAEWFNIYKEKFAKLILENCYLWAKDNGGLCCEVDFSALKEHFGVE